MALDPYEVQYFIQQVGLAAASFGVAMEDVQAVGESLQNAFGFKCAPKTNITPDWKPELQSICIAVSIVNHRTWPELIERRMTVRNHQAPRVEPTVM